MGGQRIASLVRHGCLLACGFLVTTSIHIVGATPGVDNPCLPPPAAAFLARANTISETAPIDESPDSRNGTYLAKEGELRLPLGVPDAIHVYYDGSGSMRGYVSPPKPGSKAVSVYTDLALTLPGIAGRRTEKIFFYKFGEKIIPMELSELTSVTKSDFYRCIGEPGTDTCMNQESRISDVFARADADLPSTLHVVLTDLFLSQEDLIGSSMGALRRPLANAFRTGKSIAVLGVNSAFNGAVYDLPSGGNYTQAHSRPLFLVMIGNDKTISELINGLNAEVLGVLDPGDMHFIQFRNETISSALDTPLDLDLSNDGGISHNKNLLGPKFGFPQLIISKNIQAQTAQFDLAKILLPDGLSLRGFALKQQLWIKIDRDDCDNSWIALPDVPPVAEISSEGDQLNVKLFNDRLTLRALPKRRVYLLHVRIDATELSDEKLLWVEDWSFSARDEIQLIENEVEFFPALNLKQLLRVFSEIANERFQTVRVVEFLIAFQLKR